MYSIVLVMAMTGTAADAPSFGLGHGCCGGCCGGEVVYSCCGGCCGGTVSYSCCGGCCGGDCHGGHKHHGCCGGGFFGGLFKGHHKHSCCGGDCHGGCCGGEVYSGCCGGCCGGTVIYSGCCGGGCCGGTVAPAAPPVEEKKPEVSPAPKKAAISAPATVIVSLPADAKLTIDGTATSSTSAVRRFVSPALEKGQDYFYTLTAEVVRDGKTVTSSKKVAVRAGEETSVSIEFSAAVAAR